MVTSIYDISSKAVNITKTTLTNILYVDDETGLLKIFKQMLEMQGAFNVETASSVEEAKKKLAVSDYDVIVSDYQMPDQTGLDFLEYLRARSIEIPFILFTGKGREEIAIEALNLGANHYINKIGKPEIVFGELNHAIKQLASKKAAEEKLQILSDVVEQSSNSIAVMDKRGKIVYANKKLLETYGLKSEDVVGKIFGSWVKDSPTMREKMREIALKIHKHNTEWSGELSNILKSGEVVWRKAKIFPLFFEDGDFTHIAYCGEDITKQKIAQEKQKESELHLGQMLEHAPEVIYISDSEGNFLYGNKKAEELLGYKRQEMIGKNMLEVGIFTKNAIPRIIDGMKANNLGEKNGPIEFEMIKKDGSTIIVEATTIPFYRNNKFEIMGIARDVTERKKAELKLQAIERKYRNGPSRSFPLLSIDS